VSLSTLLWVRRKIKEVLLPRKKEKNPRVQEKKKIFRRQRKKNWEGSTPGGGVKKIDKTHFPQNIE